jgi:hypothetical protein
MPNTRMGPFQRALLSELQRWDQRFPEQMLFTIGGAGRLMQWTYDQAESAMGKLKRRGYIEQIGRQNEAKTYRLTESGRQASTHDRQ